MKAPLTRPDSLELVGLGEAARACETTSRQMLSWSRREDFPAPVAGLKVLVWHRAEIVRWSKDHQNERVSGIPRGIAGRFT